MLSCSLTISPYFTVYFNVSKLRCFKWEIPLSSLLPAPASSVLWLCLPGIHRGYFHISSLARHRPVSLCRVIFRVTGTEWGLPSTEKQCGNIWLQTGASHGDILCLLDASTGMAAASWIPQIQLNFSHHSSSHPSFLFPDNMSFPAMWKSIWGASWRYLLSPDTPHTSSLD